MNLINNVQVFICLLALLASCNEETFYGSGTPLIQERELEPFTKIESSGIFELKIAQGSNQQIEIIADDNIIHKIKTEVQNGILNIYFDDGNYRNVAAQINIVVEQLTNISNEGTGDIQSHGFHEIDELKIFNSGTGNIIFGGSANKFELENVGTGMFTGLDLVTQTSIISILGSGDCYVLAEEQLKGKIEGSGDIVYDGNPLVEIEVKGSGKVMKWIP